MNCHCHISELISSFIGIPVMALLTAPLYGDHFLCGVITSNIGLSAPSRDTVHPRSKVRVFLPSKNTRRLLCMGRTCAVYKPILTQLWKSTLGMFAVNARNGAKCKRA